MAMCERRLSSGGPEAGRSRSGRTLVFSRRKMNWKFDFSPDTSDIFAVLMGCCRGDEARQGITIRCVCLF